MVNLLAVNRSASQSSTAGLFAAWKAYDNTPRCSSTTESIAPWWKVDLGDMYTVHDVLVERCQLHPTIWREGSEYIYLLLKV